jgi:hypothetical protein
VSLLYLPSQDTHIQTTSIPPSFLSELLDKSQFDFKLSCWDGRTKLTTLTFTLLFTLCLQKFGTLTNKHISNQPKNRIYNHTLVCYYSDQRDPHHGQKLSHQTSSDLRTWSPPVDDVAYEEYIARPGMTVVAYIPPIQKWIVVYELPRGNSSSHGVNYPVYYRLASSPLDFRFSEGLPIVIDDKIAPNASPYVVWSPVGGPNGTIVVSDADNSPVYTNRVGGDVDNWEIHATPAGATYSRAIHVLSGRPDSLMIFGGETFDDMRAGLLTPFTATVVSLEETLRN